MYAFARLAGATGTTPKALPCVSLFLGRSFLKMIYINPFRFGAGGDLPSGDRDTREILGEIATLYSSGGGEDLCLILGEPQEGAVWEARVAVPAKTAAMEVSSTKTLPASPAWR